MVRFLCPKKIVNVKKSKTKKIQNKKHFLTVRNIQFHICIHTHIHRQINTQTQNETHTYTEQTKKIQERSKYIRMTEQHIIQQHTNKANRTYSQDEIKYTQK